MGPRGAATCLNLLRAVVPSCFLFWVSVGVGAAGSAPPSSPAQSWAYPQISLKEGLPCEEKGGEEETEEDSSLKLCVPGIVTLQSPLHKTFRSTDTVGKCGAPTSPPSQLPHRRSPTWVSGSWMRYQFCDHQVEPEDLR